MAYVWRLAWRLAHCRLYKQANSLLLPLSFQGVVETASRKLLVDSVILSIVWHPNNTGLCLTGGLIALNLFFPFPPLPHKTSYNRYCKVLFDDQLDLMISNKGLIWGLKSRFLVLEVQILTATRFLIERSPIRILHNQGSYTCSNLFDLYRALHLPECFHIRYPIWSLL